MMKGTTKDFGFINAFFVATLRRGEYDGMSAWRMPASAVLPPSQEDKMKLPSLLLRSAALACALCAASIPAPAQRADTQQQRMATLKKEINAAYAQQKRECRQQPRHERAGCLKEARKVYRSDMEDAPTLVARGPNPEVLTKTTVPSGAGSEAGATAVGSSGGASTAVGSSGGGATGASAGCGHGMGQIKDQDMAPPRGDQSGGLPPPRIEPSEVPSTPPREDLPPVQR
jgi:hypothetical protein